MMERIIQNPDINLVQSKKTVEWLVENTEVSVFDPKTLKGYQRKIDNTHCEKIVSYLKESFLLPTAIICASDDEYNEDVPLRIVDGQHRVHAFKLLKESDSARYDQIKEYEIPIIVLSKVDIEVEIDTFITINKTSKKVDTSLAYVLKNIINRRRSEDDLSISKAEYLSVEVAYRLNYDESSIWYEQISFDGNFRNTPQTISLNAFVKSTRILINQMAKKGIISMDWENEDSTNNNVDIIKGLLNEVWDYIRMRKWQVLFSGSEENKRIIQGAIGYSAINRVITEKLKESEIDNIEYLLEHAKSWIKRIDVDYSYWLPGGRYSKYSSMTGYNIVAKELLNSME